MASFFDDFTGTTGALLRQRSGWSFSGNVAFQDRGTISNNRVKCGGGGGASGHYGYVRDVGDTQQFVEAKFLRNSGVGCCLYARWTSDSSFIAIRNSGSNVELIKRVAGTITSVVSVAAGLAVGDTVRLELRGTTAKLFKNGAQIGATGGYTIADSSVQSATKVGLGGEGAVGSFEFFDDIAGGGLTAPLAPAKASHAGRADAAGVAARFALAAADARSAVSSDAVPVGFTARASVAAAHARSVMRGHAAGLTLRFRMTGARGAHALRAGVTAVGWRGVLRSEGGRSAVRGVARVRRPIGVPGIGEVTRVGADAGLAVFGEVSGVRVLSDFPSP